MILTKKKNNNKNSGKRSHSQIEKRDDELTNIYSLYTATMKLFELGSVLNNYRKAYL